MNDAKRAIDFIQTLKIPEGPKAGKPIKLAKFQHDFIRGALKKQTAVAVLSVGRGNGKSALTAGLHDVAAAIRETNGGALEDDECLDRMNPSRKTKGAKP